MAALAMPYSLVFPPKARSEGLSDGGVTKWRHPMARVSEMQYEAALAMNKFGMLFHDWLKLPKEVRIFQMLVYRMDREQENFANTPKERQFNYFNRD